MRPSTRSGRRPGRPHFVAGLDARERLLDAAVARFAQEGIAATSTAKIARDAGVTSAMVHYYFTNRDSLLDAVAEERLLRNVNAVWAPVTDAEGNAPELVRGLVQRIMQAGQAQPWLPTLWLREVVSEGGQLRERLLKRLPVAQLQKFVTILAEAQRRGEVNTGVEARLAIVSVLGLTLLPLATMGIWRSVPQLKGITAEELARHAEALLRHGLFAPAPKPRRRR
ncbi:MAG TPA: TetR/AcrR family transcriptional regulator [Steroidobacteraceae bacterium]|jgi:AcrR family transcriptional regulator|nr:TetR/AcrR family transcriptional regulator [Steroidobacteraceae bacterium]